MSGKKIRVRKVSNGFVGIMLPEELLKKTDELAKKMTLNRSQVIRLALLDYLKDNK